MTRTKLTFIFVAFYFILTNYALAYSGYFSITNNSMAESMIITNTYKDHGNWRCPYPGDKNPANYILAPGATVQCQVTTTGAGLIHERWEVKGVNGDGSATLYYYCGLPGAPTFCTDGMAHQFGVVEAKPDFAFVQLPDSQNIVYNNVTSCPSVEELQAILDNSNGCNSDLYYDNMAWGVDCPTLRAGEKPSIQAFLYAKTSTKAIVNVTNMVCAYSLNGFSFGLNLEQAATAPIPPLNDHWVDNGGKEYCGPSYSVAKSSHECQWVSN